MLRLNREVYLLFDDHTSDVGDPVEIQVALSWDDLTSSMTSLNFEDEEANFKILHGVIVGAKALPPKLYNCDVFVIFVDPEDGSQGVVVDMSMYDLDGLADGITRVVTSEEINKPFEITIDNTFILYGYELSSNITVDDDSIDEEAIEAALKVAAEVKTMEEVRDRMFGDGR